jgi:hypothetical protein
MGQPSSPRSGLGGKIGMFEFFLEKHFYFKCSANFEMP